MVLQWSSGAYGVEFGGDESDEPAHYVTGLMVRDYVAALAPVAPMKFATEYYQHYPKVAFGHWPPVFYLVQTAWMIPFGVSRVSVLLLMAVLSALLAISLSRAVSEFWGPWAGLGAGALLLSLPIVQRFSRDIMAETLVALLVFQAVRAYGRYLDSGRWCDAAWFGAWAALAILTKGTAFVLGFVPLFSVVITRRWRLLREPAFWIPLGVVLVTCGPWYALVPRARHERVYEYGHIRFRMWPVLGGQVQLAAIVGWLPAPFLLAGLIERGIKIVKKQAVPGLWIAAAALLVGLLIFRVSVGAASPIRILTLLLPAALLFSAAGCAWLLPNARLRWAVVPALLAALIVFNLYHRRPKPARGYVPLSQQLLADRDLRGAPLLICADEHGEGMLISEMAMHEARPGHVIIRATKALASVGWMRTNYRLLYQSPDEVSRYLDQAGVGAVVVDNGGVEPMSHQELLATTIASKPLRWQVAYVHGPLSVYKRAALK